MTTFCTPSLDRRSESRDDPAVVAQLWDGESARLLLVDGDDQVLLAGDHPGKLGRLVGVPTVGQRDDQRQYLLGVRDGVAWFTQRIEDLGVVMRQMGDAGGARPSGRSDQGSYSTSASSAQGLRDVARPVAARQAVLDRSDQELLWSALALLAWHESDPTCIRCHGHTVVTVGGLSRRCVDCGALVFPRTDPAVIVAVLDDDDRLLLARQATWDPGRMSVVAGFIEAGETAEHAVAREVREETGLDVRAVRYLTSQPWPFPRSLMLAYVARATGEVRVDGVELAEGGWYTTDEVRRLTASGAMGMPSPISVARRLVEAWLHGALPVPESDVDLPMVVGQS